MRVTCGKDALEDELGGYEWCADDLIATVHGHLKECVVEFVAGLSADCDHTLLIEIFDEQGSCGPLFSFGLEDALMSHLEGYRNVHGAHVGKFTGDEAADVRGAVANLRAIADKLEADIVA